MLTLGEQLILIALDSRNGVLRRAAVMQFGLNAAGLADLLDQELISLRRPDGRFGITPIPGAGPEPLDDRLLDTVLQRLWATPAGYRHPEGCIRRWREPSLHTYLESLRDRGILDWDKPRNPKDRYGRFQLLDAEAAADALARVDRVRTGVSPDARDLDLAGIVRALGLDTDVYSGFRGRSKRAALAAATEKQRFAMLLGRAVPQVAGQTFTFDSSRDLAMAQDMIRAATFDAHHSDGGGGGHHH